MTLCTRSLSLTLLAAAASLALRAHAPAGAPTIRGRFMYAEGSRTEGHRSPATLAFQDSKAVSMVDYPHNPDGRRDLAQFKLVPLVIGTMTMPTATLERGLKVVVHTDGRDHLSILTDEVKAAPAHSHNELVVTMVKKPGDKNYEVTLKVEQVQGD